MIGFESHTVSQLANIALVQLRMILHDCIAHHDVSTSSSGLYHSFSSDLSTFFVLSKSFLTLRVAVQLFQSAWEIKDYLLLNSERRYDGEWNCGFRLQFRILAP